ncbi:MAG: RNA-binding protein S4 [Proteobacteria bacterium]|nr:RNA-binding protein S4 [Pseudomonadota bacterium]
MGGFENKCTAQAVRVDKWLWAARMFKTRTLAGTACSAGHVKVNGDVARSSKKVRPGDSISALTQGGRRILKVLILAEKRGPASFAQTLYEDNTPEQPKELAPPRLERGKGRPRKKDRRRLNKIKRGF